MEASVPSQVNWTNVNIKAWASNCIHVKEWGVIASLVELSLKLGMGE